MIAGLLCGGFWFVIFFLGQLSVLRLRNTDRPHATNRVIVGCLLGITGNLFLVSYLLPSSSLMHGGLLMGLLWAILTFSCLFILYMPFYYTVASSLSVRTLVLLASKRAGSMPIKDIKEQFISRTLVEHRLEIMRANGFLSSKDQRRFDVTPKGKRFARIFAGLKRLWRMDAGG